LNVRSSNGVTSMTPDQAKQLCIKAHTGQFRLDGITPYSSHPIAVADLLETDDEKIVAYLHDVIEDTKVTASYLSSIGFKYVVTKAILRLTKEQGQSYDDYLDRVVTDPLATKVKLADMFHNLSDTPTPRQKAKYLKGIKVLLKSL